MRFLPILLVAAVVGIQASPLGLKRFKKHGNCSDLDQRCKDAKTDCDLNYATEGFTNSSSCIEGRYGVYAGDVPGSVCDWAVDAPKCRHRCMKGIVDC
ncbi:BZ3500_MvSof-1268-A1-R1_Chr5-1g07598 [Microbotryum saponariae]|uniref:BZ3500_MvSof-1268-A1-R1_Chr5-1g07598 protein n=1 Tax=Microbotryum saponariae TaxID=289078 RepID=A0A2X0LI27_9BASI|nr:BZ3500_MvSof-1268-A1-R1_Chr5-1g07598 [Microbotryum saponariae]SDA05469.1 BZ3501_MvSof-1269-A2-R1_Chr5-2g07422 [Microbotryum saponariae]